jgi:hypothetical protein
MKKVNLTNTKHSEDLVSKSEGLAQRHEKHNPWGSGRSAWRAFGAEFMPMVSSILALVLIALIVCQEAGSQSIRYASISPPSKPLPATGAKGVSRKPTLRWDISETATSYDVYFGRSTTPPLIMSTTNNAFVPGLLNPAIIYYWRAVARNADGAMSSDTWSFQTAGKAVLSCDLNSDGAVNVLDVQLAVNQAIKTVACNSADLNQDGVCDRVDVQRVVDAAMGKAYRIGP